MAAAAGASEAPGDLGAVAIGRNEGARLTACLEALRRRVRHLVYVDSGSSDDSVAIARGLGLTVIELDRATPFTAARARNAGYRQLAAGVPGLRYMQFVDGDCELVEGWLTRGRDRLEARPELAAVCGRVRERYRDRSVYNRLCDMEWDTPVGETNACGGNAMMRLAALEDVGGFNPALIAGEEPELCLRLRQRGHKIERLDADMVLHDAAITRFGQWWKRAVRSGHAYAEGAYLHGRSGERHRVREVRRIVLWGALVPGVALGGMIPTLGLSSLLLLGYPVSAGRVFRDARRRGYSRPDAALNAAFTTLAKVAEAQGVARFGWGRISGRASTLIEHKEPAP